MGSISCTTEPLTAYKDCKWFTGIIIIKCRSIGKQYDWELEKFRLGKKGVDRGNKRRAFKNFFRFVKNPISYTFWKIDRFFPTIPKLIPIMFVFTWIMAFWEMKKYSNANKNLD